MRTISTAWQNQVYGRVSIPRGSHAFPPQHCLSGNVSGKDGEETSAHHGAPRSKREMVIRLRGFPPPVCGNPHADIDDAALSLRRNRAWIAVTAAAAPPRPPRT